MKKIIDNFKGNNLYLIVSSYKNNNRIYLGLETEEELYGDITINLTDMMLPDDNYIFINNDVSKELRTLLEKKDIISKSLGTIQYNMSNYDIVKTDFNMLKKYDSIGFKEFEDKNYNMEDYEL